MSTFDATAAARLRRTYATPAVVAQRQRTLERLAPEPGEQLLDLGCGPGHLTVGMARAVGPTGAVVGLDPSEPMLAVAREEVAADEVAERVTLLAGEADALPLPDTGLDGAAVVQVLEHVPDPAEALAELHQVLRPGARLVVVDTDWRSCVWASDDRVRTDRVLRAWENRFAHPDLPARLTGMLEATGFGGVGVEALPIIETRTEDDTYSMGMVGAIAAFVGDADRLGTEEAQAWRADIRGRARRGEYLFSLTRFLFVADRR